MNKIVFITDGVNFKRGKGIVSKNNLMILNDIFGAENVTVVSIVEDPDKNDFIEFTKNYIFFVGRNKNRILTCINLFFMRGYFLSRKDFNSILKIVGKNKIVFIDDSYFGKLAKKLKKRNNYIISFYHDIRRVLAKQWLFQRGVKFIPGYICTIVNEYMCAKWSDINIVLNDRDKQLLKNKYNKEADLVLPISIKSQDIENYCSNKSCTRGVVVSDIDLLFVGADYFPNIEGIKWFIQNVLNELPENRKLTIVGFNMEKYAQEFSLLSNKVNVIGSVDDLTIYYKAANIIVSPIFQGGGMKVKIAEAMMHGKYIIAAKEALEGYCLTDDIILANSASEFISGIEKLTLISDIRNFSQDNYDLFKSKYSFESSMLKVKKLLLSRKIYVQ